MKERRENNEKKEKNSKQSIKYKYRHMNSDIDYKQTEQARRDRDDQVGFFFFKPILFCKRNKTHKHK